MWLRKASFPRLLTKYSWPVRVLRYAFEHLKNESQKERKATRAKACVAKYTSCYNTAFSGFTHNDSIMRLFIF